MLHDTDMVKNTWKIISHNTQIFTIRIFCTKIKEILSNELSSYRQFIGFRVLVLCVSIFFINPLCILYYLSIIKANILLLVPQSLIAVKFLKVIVR